MAEKNICNLLKRSSTRLEKCLDSQEVTITDVKKILIHQANEKMDKTIINRFYKLYELEVKWNNANEYT
jgi:3-oxoacyl-[acyl-carrier-protein] synthase-3